MKKTPLSRGDFKIIDNVENCATAIEEIYRDDKYIYTLSCIKSGAVIVEFDNGERYSIKEALNKKYVTPDQIIKKGYPLGKSAIVVGRGDFKIIDESWNYSCASVVEVVFENNKWICYNECGIFVQFDNGDKYSVDEALKNGYVTPDQLKDKGYTKSCKLK